MLQSLLNFRPAPSITKTTVKNITPAQLQQRLATEPLIMVDVRSPEEYAQGHIAQSRLLPLWSLLQRANELPKDKPIVCVCRSGNRSMAACQQLAAQGFTNLYNLSGGVVAWHQANLPLQF